MKTHAYRLDNLHPTLREKGLKLIELAKAEGINIIITQGLRTVEEQDALYAKGRTSPGSKVTNARGGHSYHNFGLAFDFAVYNPSGSINWNVDSNWKRVGELGQSLGLEWGGVWTSFIDYPHFQLTFGLSTAELRAGKKPPEPKKEEKPMESKFSREDANRVINILSALWMATNIKGVKEATHFAAEALRKEVGIDGKNQ